MFRRLISAVLEDDNPRLHRIPFLMLWILSFGLAWYTLYIYEILWYDWTFDPFLSWLKYSGYEGYFVGLLFGLTLSFIQTWLIRQRYGFVPRFWRMATIIGAILAGYGYPRIGLRTGESFIGYNWMVGGSVAITSIDSLINDFFIWFMVLSLFQTIALFRVNRKAWLFIVVGLLAVIVASVPLTNSRILYGKPMWTLIMGTAIHTLGTGLLFLYLMAHPREGIVLKRDKITGTKSGVLAATPFVMLWVGLKLLVPVLSISLNHLWRFMVYYSPTELYENWNLSDTYKTWYFAVIFSGTLGLIAAIGRQWLMKKHSQHIIPYWVSLSVIGSMIAGLISWANRYMRPDTQLEENFLFLASMTIPLLFQAIPMNRVIGGGWLWAGTAILAGMIRLYIQSLNIRYLSGFYSSFASGLFLSIATALIFVWLASRQEKTKTAIEPVIE